MLGFEFVSCCVVLWFVVRRVLHVVRCVVVRCVVFPQTVFLGPPGSREFKIEVFRLEKPVF